MIADAETHEILCTDQETKLSTRLFNTLDSMGKFIDKIGKTTYKSQ
jgi:hypothetical protein